MSTGANAETVGGCFDCVVHPIYFLTDGLKEKLIQHNLQSPRQRQLIIVGYV
jgi:hypothetical protein